MTSATADGGLGPPVIRTAPPYIADEPEECRGRYVSARRSTRRVASVQTKMGCLGRAGDEYPSVWSHVRGGIDRDAEARHVAPAAAAIGFPHLRQLVDLLLAVFIVPLITRTSPMTVLGRSYGTRDHARPTARPGDERDNECEQKQINKLPQVWKTNGGGGWRNMPSLSVPIYPQNYVAPDGRVFVAGSAQATHLYLNTAGNGAWSNGPKRTYPDSYYGSSAMYDGAKILMTGGGNPPSAVAEVIDLDVASPAWRRSAARWHSRADI